ncbi:MAG: adenylate/guanylate cyclase domain-containing protein [Arcobacter sp.]|nr:MAG: adenylate/guanylate cyclase domain-containing protein [Arcobacter sp.]
MTMNTKLKKITIYSFAALIIFIIVLVSKIYFNEFTSSLDGQIRDYMFKTRGEIKTQDNIIIIDIDEKSLSELGQWPWPRNKVAKILEQLALAGIGVIGLDIVFAELDQSSPAKIFKEYNIQNIEAPDYDKDFNFMVANTPTILGYSFELSKQKFLRKEALNIAAVIVERNKNQSQEYLILAQGTILNHQKLQESAYSSGFFNVIPDINGVIRSVPLLIKYNDQLYPSLALEIIRAAMQVEAIFINYNELGVESIQIGNTYIPTDRYARLLVNFRGPNHTFKYYSAIDIYNGNFKKEDIEGKVALLGTTAAGLNDLRSIPFESVFPGVEVHANIIDNIISGDFLSQPSWIDAVNIICVLFIIILTILLVTLSPLWANPFVLFIVSGSTLYGVYYTLFEYGLVINSFLLIFAVFLSVLIATFMDYVFEIKKEQIIKNKFASKVSKEVMESLINNEKGELKASTKEISIFFSNVRNFSLISEASPNATVLIDFLNEYVEPMSKIIIKEKGTIDKFMGDSIMAYWNAPVDIKNHATKALDCALKQVYEIKKINKLIVSNKKFENIIRMCAYKNIAPLELAIGINTGVAVIGEMGSELRSDYTIIGDSVNIGFKLESLCRYYGTKINISDSTKLQVEDKYIFRYLDFITIKGHEEAFKIWEVIDFDTASINDNLYKISRESLDEELFQYHTAIKFYQEAMFEDAIEIFNTLNKKENNTNDKIYKIYIQRCKDYLKEYPKEFDGVFKF